MIDIYAEKVSEYVVMGTPGDPSSYPILALRTLSFSVVAYAERHVEKFPDWRLMIFSPFRGNPVYEALIPKIKECVYEVSPKTTVEQMREIVIKECPPYDDDNDPYVYEAKGATIAVDPGMGDFGVHTIAPPIKRRSPKTLHLDGEISGHIMETIVRRDLSDHFGVENLKDIIKRSLLNGIMEHIDEIVTIHFSEDEFIPGGIRYHAEFTYLPGEVSLTDAVSGILKSMEHRLGDTSSRIKETTDKMEAFRMAMDRMKESFYSFEKAKSDYEKKGM